MELGNSNYLKKYGRGALLDVCKVALQSCCKLDMQQHRNKLLRSKLAGGVSKVSYAGLTAFPFLRRSDGLRMVPQSHGGAKGSGQKKRLTSPVREGHRQYLHGLKSLVTAIKIHRCTPMTI